MGNRGIENEVSFVKGEKGEKGLAAIFFLGNQQDSERGIGTVVKI